MRRALILVAALTLGALIALYDTVADPDERVVHRSTPPTTAHASRSSDFGRPEPFVIDGTLIVAWSDMFLLRVSDGDTFVVRVGPDTQICRLSCHDTSETLQTGDHVEVATERDAHGWRIAEWINANVYADYVVIEEISGPFLRVHTTRGPDGHDLTPYVLVINAHTIIEPATGREPERVGSFDGARIGDWIYYVGATDTANERSLVFAWRVFPLQMP